jgi:UDP-N-acetylglucosamine:LPS N-acetylglucosamine transferase
MSKKETPVKICLVASAGGHLSQLLKIVQAVNGHEAFVVTTSEAVRENLTRFGQVHVVGECNRQHGLRVVRVVLTCWRILRHERPNVILSTGAAPGCVCCFLGKLMGAKIIWVDSITNVGRLSLSGWLVRYIADLFIVQWAELAQKYRGTEYVGTIV